MDQVDKPYTHSIADILGSPPPQKKQNSLIDILTTAPTPHPLYNRSILDIIDSPAIPQLFFQKLNCMAISPERSTPGSAGLDLFSPYTVALVGNEQRLIPTHLRFVIPKGYYGRVACTSGNCYRHRLSVGAGVIDQDYDGDVGVLLANNSINKPVMVQRGQKIAQLILEKITIPRLHEITRAPKPERVISFGRRNIVSPQRSLLRKS
jgi:dUTP pyrophosphatase